MTTLVERYCERCLRIPLHERRNGRFICTECGSISTEAEEQRREVQRRKNFNAPSVTTTASVLPPASDGSDESFLPEPGARTTDEDRGERFAAATEGDRWDAVPQYAAVVLALAGLSVEIGPEQHTRIGGEEVWARVWLDKRGSHVVRLATRVRGRRSLCLTEVYAMQRARDWFRPGRPEQARWQLAALVEVGILEPPSVRLRALPADAPRLVVTLWPYIAELVALRRIREPDERTLPLSAPFLVRWCRKSLTETEIALAKRWLERHGLITRAGAIPSSSPARRDTVLWIVAEAELGHDGEPW